MNNYNDIYYDYYNTPVREFNNMEMNNNQNNKLFNPVDGFEKGNLFSGLYDQYKNYKPSKIVPRNDEEKSLLEIQIISFAINDLNLYLDVNPNDKSMLQLLKDYISKKEKLTKEYEMKYKPLTLYSNNIGQDTFNWVKDKWTWEDINV